MRLPIGLLAAMALAGPYAAWAQASWTPDAYNPRDVERPRPSAPPPRIRDAQPHYGGAEQAEGHWESRWVPAPKPPAYAPPSVRRQVPEPGYVQSPVYADEGFSPPPRADRHVPPRYADGWSQAASSATASVVVQNAPITITTTETITEYIVEEATRTVRRAAPAKAKRRVAKRPRCVCHIVYR